MPTYYLKQLRSRPPGIAADIAASLWMEVVFSWTAVGGATSYTLQVGTSSGASDYGIYVVGNVLTYTLNLPPGTYYARVVDNFTGTPSTEQGPFYV
jgi:hypothetical protein